MRKKLVTVLSDVKSKKTLICVTATTTAMTIVPSMQAFASESGGSGGVSGKSLLSGELLTNVQQGIADIQFTGIQVIGLVVVAALAVVGASAAANFVIKKIKGVLSKAG